MGLSKSFLSVDSKRILDNRLGFTLTTILSALARIWRRSSSTLNTSPKDATPTTRDQLAQRQLVRTTTAARNVACNANEYSPFWPRPSTARMYLLSRKLSFDWKAWLGWILATLAGIELCVLCLYHLVRYVLIEKFPVIGPLAILATAGTILGTAQWFWLRKRSTIGLWWITASVGGWYLTYGSWFLLSLTLKHIAGGEAFLNSSSAWLPKILFYSILSMLVALPQLFLLRRHVSRSYWWVGICPFSWFAGWALFYVASSWNVIEFGWFEPARVFGFRVTEIVGWGVVFLCFGTGIGAVTGATSVFLISKPKSLSPSDR